MLTGYLRSKGTSISENTVAKVTKKIYPYHASERHFKAAQNLNPNLYHADYFGQKLHVDQNQKTCDVRCNTCDSKRWLLRNGCGNRSSANQK